MVKKFCEVDIGKRVLKVFDPRGPAGNIINYKQRNLLDQRQSTFSLSNNPIIQDKTP